MKRGPFLYCLPLLLLVLTSCSRDPKALVDNGNKFYARGLYKEAAIMYKKALTKDQKLSEAYYRLALADLQLGAAGEAVSMLRRAVGDPAYKNNDAAVQLANIYLFASTQNEKQGPQLLEEADTLAQNMLAKDPNSFDGHRLAGQIALLKKDPKTAVAELQIANQAKPNQSEVVLAYFEALVANNQKPAAEKLARDFISQDKTVGAVYDRLYVQYMIDKRLDDAEQILKLKSDNNPKSANYVLQLAAHYIVVNRRADMEATMRRLADEKQFPDGRLLAGDFYFARMREFELAKQQYEAGIAAFPHDKLIYQKRMVELYANMGNNVQANQLIETLVKENPKDADVIAMHAALMLSSGKRDQVNQAVIDLQSLSNKSPQNYILKYNLARALLAQVSLQASTTKDGKDALEPARLQLEDAIKLRTDFVAARELLARVYLAKNDPAKALQTCDELLEIDRNNLSGHLVRSASLLALKNNSKAREELDVITRLFPQNADARYQVGLLAYSDKDYKKAEQVFEAMYRDNHDNRGLLGLTETLTAQNRLDDAIKEMDKALAVDPDRRDLRIGRANLYVRAQRYDEAIATYKSLLDKEPNSADLLFKLGETYRRKGDINLAVDEFRKSSQAAPNSTAPLVYLGMILETIGPIDQANAVYQQILKLDPNNPLALNNLAFHKAEEGQDLDSALSMAQRAHQMLPDANNMADTLGWIYIKKNLSSQAEGIFKDLVVKEPTNAVFHYHYGMALMQKGDKTSARRELETALRNKPSKDDAGKIQDLLTKL